MQTPSRLRLWNRRWETSSSRLPVLCRHRLVFFIRPNRIKKNLKFTYCFVPFTCAHARIIIIIISLWRVAGLLRTTVQRSTVNAAAAAAADDDDDDDDVSSGTLLLCFDRAATTLLVPPRYVRRHDEQCKQQQQQPPWYHPVPLSAHQAALFLRSVNQRGCFLVYRDADVGE